jgi:hypothetical protein
MMQQNELEFLTNGGLWTGPCWEGLWCMPTAIVYAMLVTTMWKAGCHWAVDPNWGQLDVFLLGRMVNYTRRFVQWKFGLVIRIDRRSFE